MERRRESSIWNTVINSYMRITRFKANTISNVGMKGIIWIRCHICVCTLYPKCSFRFLISLESIIYVFEMLEQNLNTTHIEQYVWSLYWYYYQKYVVLYYYHILYTRAAGLRPNDRYDYIFVNIEIQIIHYVR